MSSKYAHIIRMNINEKANVWRHNNQSINISLFVLTLLLKEITKFNETTSHLFQLKFHYTMLTVVKYYNVKKFH